MNTIVSCDGDRERDTPDSSDQLGGDEREEIRDILVGRRKLLKTGSGALAGSTALSQSVSAASTVEDEKASFSETDDTAPTFVTDDITDDVKWNASEGPYRVTSSITVEDDTTLVVEPGTRVECVDGITLTIKGMLTLAGSSTERVTLIGFEGSYGIVVASDGELSLEHATVNSVNEDIVLDGGTASITESTIEGSIGYQNDTSELTLVGSTVSGQLFTVFTGTRPNVDGLELRGTVFTSTETNIDFDPDRHIRDVQIKECTFAGEVLFNDSFEITSDIKSRAIRLKNSDFSAPVVFDIGFEESTIEGNTFTGEGDGIRTTTVRRTDIVGNDFCDNSGNGVVIDDIDSSVVFRDNTVENNDADGLRASANSGIAVKENTIRKNGGSGISIDAAFNPDLTGVVIEGNRVVINAEHGIEFFDCELDVVTVSDNEVLANDSVGLRLDAPRLRPDGDTTTLSDNTVAYNAVGVLLRNDNKTLVERNAIARNENTGIQIDRPGDTISKNNIFDNSIGVNTGDESGANATENHWGAESGPFVEGVNPDGEGNEVKSDGENVAFIPWAESPIQDAPEVPDENPGAHESGVDQELFEAVDQSGDGDVSLGDLQDAVEEWSGNQQIDGVEASLDDLRAIVDWWAS